MMSLWFHENCVQNSRIKFSAYSCTEMQQVETLSYLCNMFVTEFAQTSSTVYFDFSAFNYFQSMEYDYFVIIQIY